MLRLFLRLWTFLFLLALLVPLSQPGLVADSGGPQLMPPHPRLREKIEQGEVSLPRILADPELARSLGLNFSPEGPQALTGSINALAVLVDFSDKVKTVTASYFDTLIFAAPVSGRGSVRDYYSEVSYGQVDIVTVNLPSSLGWKRAPQTYSYYVGYCGPNCGYCMDAIYPNNCQKLAEDIVDAVDSVVNFANYDNDGDGSAEPIMLVHAGPGAEFTGNETDIWSHSWGLGVSRFLDGVWISDYVIMPEYWLTVNASSSDMTIGVFAHEMGHGFWGLPDVYDRDYSSEGVGNWSLMAGGSWNGPNSGGWGTDGSSPAWPDAWNRTQMGFVSASNVASNVVGQSIPRAYNNPPPAQTVFKLSSTALGAQEYFLLENRQRVSGSYDQYLPEGGLLVWHVDEAMNTYTKQNDYECTSDPHCNCSDTQHFLLALEQADGARHLEYGTNSGDNGDPFPGSTNNRTWTMTTHPESSSWYACTNTCIGVTNISNSLATMTADLQVTCGVPPVYDEFVYLPLVMRNYGGGGPGGWTTIMSEDFEGSFPAGWSVFDNDGTTNGEYYWGKRSCRSHAGSYSGWGVGGGANGGSLSCGSNYPNNADSWMVYGPFSLADASAADLSFKQWVNVEAGYDKVCRYASSDGSSFYGNCTSADTLGWDDRVLDLTNVYILGDLTGQPNVWIALRFSSDGTFNEPEGGYVDDILLRKYVGTMAPPATGNAAADPAMSHEEPASFSLNH
jgi:immune inhibitor A